MLQPHEPIQFMAVSGIDPVFLAAVSLAPLDGQWVLLLGSAVAVMYRNWRADEKERRLEHKQADEAVTAALNLIKEEKHGDKMEALNARMDKFEREVLNRFDRLERHFSAQPQALQRIVPSVPEDDPRATG